MITLGRVLYKGIGGIGGDDCDDGDECDGGDGGPLLPSLLLTC